MRHLRWWRAAAMLASSGDPPPPPRVLHRAGRQTDRQTGRGRQTDRQTDGQTDIDSAERQLRARATSRRARWAAAVSSRETGHPHRGGSKARRAPAQPGGTTATPCRSPSTICERLLAPSYVSAAPVWGRKVVYPRGCTARPVSRLRTAVSSADRVESLGF